MLIIPTLLVPTYSELQNQLKKVDPLFDYAQIDIMDGKLVDNKSFNYNENKNLEKFFSEKCVTKLKFELHLMVKNPIEEIKKWENIKNIFRVIFHIECDDNPVKIIAKIKENGWQAGIALNPKTSLSKITPYLNSIDMVLFMTVIPGKQGSPFVEEVGKKVKELYQSSQSQFSGRTKNTTSSALTINWAGGTLANPPLVAVDGGVNKKTIELIKSWGVNVANVGSALMGASNIKEAYNKLEELME
jgi:ribulose-phosphate 3-epimerase